MGSPMKFDGHVIGNGRHERTEAQEVQGGVTLMSFPRRRESRGFFGRPFWIPVFTGMTSIFLALLLCRAPQ